MTAALLHDTIEDTTTDFDDLAETFDNDIATWVAALSKDKRRFYDAREEAYCHELANAPWQVQVCKLADVFDNLMDSRTMAAPQQARTVQNARRYLDALRTHVQEQAAGPLQIVARLCTEIEARA
jgi:(p)ppGpp synthase/HD superfamily hydrolase